MTLTDSPTSLDSGSILNGLLPTVKTLSHVDKIRLMHFLMTDLVQREGINLIEPDKITDRVANVKPHLLDKKT